VYWSTDTGHSVKSNGWIYPGGKGSVGFDALLASEWAKVGTFRAGEHQFREVFGVTEMKKAPIGD